MKFTKIAAVAAVALAGSLGTANAAPLSGLAKAPAAEAGIVEVHRRHQSCVLPPGRGRLASYTAPGRADRVLAGSGVQKASATAGTAAGTSAGIDRRLKR